MTDSETSEAATRNRPPRRAPRRPAAPVRSTSSVVVPVVGLLAFAGLAAIGFMVLSRRRGSATSLLSSLPPMPHIPSLPHVSMPHMPALPHMSMPHIPSMPHLSMPHMPSFDLRWVGRLAVVSAAQAAISHLVQSAMRTWR